MKIGLTDKQHFCQHRLTKMTRFVAETIPKLWKCIFRNLTYNRKLAILSHHLCYVRAVLLNYREHNF